MRKMKRFADGGSAKYKAKYDRKVADIESDYEKAKARKTGRDAEVAKAKYEQRMADAKDDLAKWTGADRSQTRAAEKAAERNLSMTRRFGAKKPDTPVSADTGPDRRSMSDADLDIMMGVSDKPRQGASDAGNFGSAFKAARSAGDKTFTWRGKSYTTELASEKPRAAPARGNPSAPARGNPSTPATPPKPTAPATPPKPTAPATPPKPTAPKPTAPKLTQSQRYTQMAARLEREAAQERAQEKGPTGSGGAAWARLKNFTGFGSDAATRAAKMYRGMATQEDKRTAAIAQQKAADAAADKARAAAKAKRNAEIIAAGEKPGASGYEKSRAKFYRANPDAMRKGGVVKKYAKGGKIDGCAVRGKTKAGRK